MTVCVVEQQRDQAVVPKREDDTRPRVPVDQIVTYLAETDKDIEDALTPLRSHDWFSAENYQRVLRWCEAALVAVGATKKSPSTKQLVQLLTNTMVDHYNNDRALRAASLLPDHPVTQRTSEIPAQRQLKNGVGTARWGFFEWRPEVPLEVTDLVAVVIGRVVPDWLNLVRYEFGSTIASQIVYARYGDWLIKVIEWK